MNREIKFKIYDKQLEETHIVELAELCEDDYWYDGETEIWSVLYDGTHEQERFVISRFTGLKDKNGVEIYEGDIVQQYGIKANGIIEYQKDRYGINCLGMFWYIHPTKTEVIGNIYENSELLKESEE